MSYYLPGSSESGVLGLPLDGLTGQVLAKASDTDYDVQWITISSGQGGASYVHNQSTVAGTWTINHNLGYRPSVELLDSGSQEIDGQIVHPSVNQTVVTLNPATAGLARLI